MNQTCSNFCSLFSSPSRNNLKNFFCTSRCESIFNFILNSILKSTTDFLCKITGLSDNRQKCSYNLSSMLIGFLFSIVFILMIVIIFKMFYSLLFSIEDEEIDDDEVYISPKPMIKYFYLLVLIMLILVLPLSYIVKHG